MNVESEIDLACQKAFLLKYLEAEHMMSSPIIKKVFMQMSGTKKDIFEEVKVQAESNIKIEEQKASAIMK